MDDNKKFDYGQFKPLPKTDPHKNKQLAEVLRSRYGQNLNPAEINRTKTRSKTYITVAIVLILIVWFVIGLLYIINVHRFYNAQTFATGDAPVVWLVEDKELKKFTTTIDIAPGVVYNLKLGIKNKNEFAVSLRLKVDFTYKNGIRPSSTYLLGVNASHFELRDDGWYYYIGTSSLLPPSSQIDFATGINIGLNNPELNYYSVRLNLYAESYKE